MKSDILGYNAARHYRIDLAANLDSDGLGRIKAAYLDDGQERIPRSRENPKICGSMIRKLSVTSSQ